MGNSIGTWSSSPTPSVCEGAECALCVHISSFVLLLCVSTTCGVFLCVCYGCYEAENINSD